MSHKVDSSSGSIGRRYARTDEIAIPYGITIDFDTLKEPNSVTLRERDSMQQVRIPVCLKYIYKCLILPTVNIAFLLQVSEIGEVIRNLSNGRELWNDIETKYPKFEQQEAK